MGKKSRRKRQLRHPKPPPIAEPAVWQAQDGFHMLVPGTPTPEMLEEMTRQYQEQLRQSPLWEKMVKKYGQKKAEELLKECRAEARPPKPGLLTRLLGLFLRP